MHIRMLGLFVASSLLACGSTADPPHVEGTRSIGQALSSSFFYLRCNSTDWGADEGSRMLPTGDPNVVTKTVRVSGATDDPCSVTETFASAPDEWGNSQTFFITPGSATLPVPGNRSRAAAKMSPASRLVSVFAKAMFITSSVSRICQAASSNWA